MGLFEEINTKSLMLKDQYDCTVYKNHTTNREKNKDIFANILFGAGFIVTQLAGVDPITSIFGKRYFVDDKTYPCFNDNAKQGIDATFKAAEDAVINEFNNTYAVYLKSVKPSNYTQLIINEFERLREAAINRINRTDSYDVSDQITKEQAEANLIKRYKRDMLKISINAIIDKLKMMILVPATQPIPIQPIQQPVPQPQAQAAPVQPQQTVQITPTPLIQYNNAPRAGIDWEQFVPGFVPQQVASF